MTRLIFALTSIFLVLQGGILPTLQMRRLIREFAAKLESNKGVGLFYYAGHGVEVRAKNFQMYQQNSCPCVSQLGNMPTNQLSLLCRTWSPRLYA